MPLFCEYIGIDYSGAYTAESRLPGIQVFRAGPEGAPVSIRPEQEPERKTWNWTRKGVFEWLLSYLSQANEPVVVGIDHAFSFSQSYMNRYGLADWDAFLADFAEHWPTDRLMVEELRNGNPRTGQPDEFRLTETWTAGAKSVFQLDGAGQVGKSTHAGLPWLKRLRDKLRERVFFWPFDGFGLPDGKSAVVEVYPSIFRRRYPRDGRTGHEHDAFAVASWLRDRDHLDLLAGYFAPPLTDEEREQVRLEGWILGVM